MLAASKCCQIFILTSVFFSVTGEASHSKHLSPTGKKIADRLAKIYYCMPSLLRDVVEHTSGNCSDSEYKEAEHDIDCISFIACDNSQTLHEIVRSWMLHCNLNRVRQSDSCWTFHNGTKSGSLSNQGQVVLNKMAKLKGCLEESTLNLVEARIDSCSSREYGQIQSWLDCVEPLYCTEASEMSMKELNERVSACAMKLPHGKDSCLFKDAHSHKH